jgi:hypothetical protein
LPTATIPPPVQPVPTVAKPVRLYFVLELEPDELLLELDEEEELELEDEELLEELELEEELLLELEELDEEDELELDEELLDPLEAGTITATESASWLLLEVVQLMVEEPVALGAKVEPAPPELDWETPQRLVWLEPGVRVELLAPLQATSTSQEPTVLTVALAEIVVPEVAVAVVAVGAVCEAPLSETEPALMPLAAPPKVTEIVAVPEVGLSR